MMAVPGGMLAGYMQTRKAEASYRRLVQTVVSRMSVRSRTFHEEVNESLVTVQANILR